MLEYIPQLIEIYQSESIRKKEPIELVLNLNHDGELNLISCAASFCTTNNHYKNEVRKQLHVFRDFESNEWVRKKAGCSCVDFKELNEDDLENDWLKSVKVGESHSGFWAKASRC